MIATAPATSFALSDELIARFGERAAGYDRAGTAVAIMGP
jgi:hypothetical protein